MKSIEEIASNYPLHWLVWQNDYSQLDKSLTNSKEGMELPDPRSKTPLMLAVMLGHLESVKVLLNHEANVNVENKEGWTVVQEAVATGDPEILQVILQKRDFEKHSSRMGGIPALLHKLKEAPDFYVEMKWEFTSWVPLVSRLCPSDTYKVYKQGSSVRIDTTLLGFDQSTWQRGDRSYVFKGEKTLPKMLRCERSYVYKLSPKLAGPKNAVMMEIDHKTKQVYVEEMRVLEDVDSRHLLPSEKAVTGRLTTPIMNTYVDTEKICFERNKSGIWGWRSDKTEIVNGKEAKVFTANNVELVTQTRTEHLSGDLKTQPRFGAKFPIHSLLGMAESENKQENEAVSEEEYFQNPGNPCNITPEEYFDEDVDLGLRDVGRPKEQTTKVQKFKATLWLCEEYPLSLPEQIMPIVDLMAISSSHFKKLKDFIHMQLPAGFPVKIEIPLFHVMNACVTFGNVFALDEPVEGVTAVEDNAGLACIVSDSCFEAPPSYVVYDSSNRQQFSMDEDDSLLQLAIQQSLLDAGSEGDEVDIWEALKAQKPSRPSTPQVGFTSEERELQRAIEASLGVVDSSFETRSVLGQIPADGDNDLAMALALSAQECEAAERRRKQEEEELTKILLLSLTDK
nr:EOG090X0784 [Triops cancriformis]